MNTPFVVWADRSILVTFALRITYFFNATTTPTGIFLYGLSIGFATGFRLLEKEGLLQKIQTRQSVQKMPR